MGNALHRILIAIPPFRISSSYPDCVHPTIDIGTMNLEKAVLTGSRVLRAQETMEPPKLQGKFVEDRGSSLMHGAIGRNLIGTPKFNTA